MKFKVFHFLILMWATMWSPGSVFAQTRYALVIGNDTYEKIDPLKKAVGDAQAMSETLRSLGFDVTLLTNASRSAFNRGLASITARIRPGDEIVLHYSGHGVQIDGENFLIPTDAPSPSSSDKNLLKRETIALSSIVNDLKDAGVRAQVIILDACRNNPYANSPTRSLGQTRGLAGLSPPKGTFIMFSAGNGQTALDRLSDTDTEPTSPYTRALIRKISVEPKQITDLARELRDEVEHAAAKVNHEQRPAYYDELSGGSFFFKVPGALAATKPSADRIEFTHSKPSDTEIRLPQQGGIELAYWNAVKDSRNVSQLESYLTKFGTSGQYASLARAEIQALRQPTTNAPTPLEQIRPQPTAKSDPAFNCSVARKRAELVICAQPTLGLKDRELVGVFGLAVARLSLSEAKALKREQAGWLRLRDSCGDATEDHMVFSCVLQRYNERISSLRMTLPAEGNAGPSFDCNNARSTVELIICNSSALASRDRALSVAFNHALTNASDFGREVLRSEQSRWLNVRELCTSTGGSLTQCLTRAYDARISELQTAR